MAADSTLDEPVSGRTEVLLMLRSFEQLSRLASSTTRICLRYRVTGLAAEAGFFALLSLPPLVLGLVASAGYVGRRIGSDVVADMQTRLSDLAGTFLTPNVVQSVIMPTFAEVVKGGRLEIVSLGFVLSLWSGSRAVNVYVDTVSIMYGLGGQRGMVRTRALSFSLYVAALMLGVLLIPLMLVGPGLISQLVSRWAGGLPSLAWLAGLYWPVVTLFSVAGLTTLYHVATPIKARWRRDLPGSVLALLIWLVASLVLRFTLERSVGGTSIYGPLSAPIVVLIWLYLLALAVLIGAALNASIDALNPRPGRVNARDEPVPFGGENAVTPLPAGPTPAGPTPAGPTPAGPTPAGPTPAGPVPPAEPVHRPNV
jgi:membrane protein